ncbi:hypothetical protein [Nitrososphaeria virus YSH_1032793]|uniref:Uncharacterized protein n=1 Tax=Nitrososphaeria virus YSH_1032793 TaxID=3071320 RepID=A0A976UAC3_9CAUD|nr:hypothetical protein QKV91_gp34 [Yangshan Harbor Nitrososphaeria virus]UVF62238.1 hypothetical protein [Nitrososphaeria virus YSH_1032793]
MIAITMGKSFWERLNFRNFLTTMIFGGYIWIFHRVFQDPSILSENSILAMMFGTYTTLVTAIGIFYYRKAQSKESELSKI